VVVYPCWPLKIHLTQIIHKKFNFEYTKKQFVVRQPFWSVTVYHPDTRSLLQNGQPKPSVSTYDEPIFNEDGSIDIYFGPEAPEGFEKNWVKTIPDEGWFAYIRLYGPLDSFFDQTWKPDDVVKVK